MLKQVLARLRSAERVEIVDPALAASARADNPAFAQAVCLFWPRPVVPLCKAKSKQRRFETPQPAKVKANQMDRHAKGDGFKSYQDYLAHKRAMPRAYPSWEEDSSPHRDECHLCCDARNSFVAPCRHEVCSRCAARLVKHSRY